MNTSCYIIDDELHAVEVLTDYVLKTPGLRVAGSATDPLTGLSEINSLQPGIIFLDIHMPGLSGIELARILNGSICIVFTTSLRDFGPEAFELGISYYLLKPIGYPQFVKCLQKIKTSVATGEQSVFKERFSFFVKSDTKGRLVRIIAHDIIYISSDQNYVHIHLPGETIKAYLTVTELMDNLPAELFCRPHRGYIVNLDHVRIVEAGMIRLSNNAVVDIGPTYREGFMERLNSRLIVSHREGKR
jgi:two-component system LytT family response regulator